MDILIKSKVDYSKFFYQILKETEKRKVNIYLYHTFLHPMDVVIFAEFFFLV